MVSAIALMCKSIYTFSISKNKFMKSSQKPNGTLTAQAPLIFYGTLLRNIDISGAI